VAGQTFTLSQAGVVMQLFDQPGERSHCGRRRIVDDRGDDR
jgi:hypothetical protein